MSRNPTEERYPVGYGMLTGYSFGLAFGIIAWLVSAQIPIGLIVFIATGTAIGVSLEQILETRPQTPRERRLALMELDA